VQGVLVGDRETMGLLEVCDDIHWVRDWRRHGADGTARAERRRPRRRLLSPVHSKSLTALYFPNALSARAARHRTAHRRGGRRWRRHAQHRGAGRSRRRLRHGRGAAGHLQLLRPHARHPADPAEAVRCCCGAPQAGAGGRHQRRVFLVNASLGLYPDLLEDREAYKARFGRSRWVAFGRPGHAAARAARLRLHIETAAGARRADADAVRRQQPAATAAVRCRARDTVAGTPATAASHALVLRPIGTLAMLGLMLHGAMGSLGEAEAWSSFEFEHLVVRPTLPQGRRA
jgi:hypothetical protein